MDNDRGSAIESEPVQSINDHLFGYHCTPPGLSLHGTRSSMIPYPATPTRLATLMVLQSLAGTRRLVAMTGGRGVGGGRRRGTVSGGREPDGNPDPHVVCSL